MRANVEAIDETQQRGGGLGGRRFALQPAKRSCSAASAPPRKMSLSRREPSPQCARTAEMIASATPGRRYRRAIGV